MSYKTKTLRAIDGSVEIRELDIGSMAHAVGKVAVSKVLSLINICRNNRRLRVSRFLLRVIEKNIIWGYNKRSGVLSGCAGGGRHGIHNERRRLMEGADIGFVHLGFYIQNLRNHISVFGFKIAYYGIIIGCGMLAGICVARMDARSRGQDPELYLDLALYAIIFSIIGARIYYVVFAWDYYKDNLLQVFNLRGGGLAIYGGVLAGTLTCYVFSRIRKVSFLSLADTGVLGLTTGQIIGRWGNFFNCEAFGGYTDGLFAMRIRKALVNPSMLNADVVGNQIVENGIEYIQVHPTFLYESMWNLCLLMFMLWYRKHKTFDGEVLCLYMFGYGLGRFWIEGLRTDQLVFFGTGIPVSQALSLLLMVAGGGIVLWRHHRKQGGNTA